MLLAILQQTPTAVYIVFCGLLYLGMTRSRPRVVPAQRLLLLPVLISAASLYSVYTAFAGKAGGLLFNSVLLTALLAWLCAAGLVLALLAGLKPRYDVRYVAPTQRFHIPGSWLPLCWLMLVFFAKYGLGVLLAIQTDLHTSASFALTVGLLYGALSGNLAGGAWRIWRVKFGHPADPDQRGATALSTGK